MDKNKELVGKIVAIMMQSRTYAHMCHLYTDSYAKHEALETFYTDIVDVIDRLAEAAQGKMGKCKIPYMDMKGDVEDPIAGIESHLKMIENVSKRVDEQYISAILDEVHGCYYRTLYRLKELN